MAEAPVDLTLDQQALVALRNAFAKEADGKKLSRDLGNNLRRAVQPAVLDAKSAVMSIPSVKSGTPPLRASVASQIGAQARMTGRTPGVAVRARRLKGHSFRNAAKALNSSAGWRHPVFGNPNVWVRQRGRPGWFESAIVRRRDQYRDAVLQAMNDMATRIAREAKR